VATRLGADASEARTSRACTSFASAELDESLEVATRSSNVGTAGVELITLDGVRSSSAIGVNYARNVLAPGANFSTSRIKFTSSKRRRIRSTPAF
jgi:hypothetical protein